VPLPIRATVRRALTVGALRHRNFRLFIIGQFVSLCGTWMQTVALAWLVFQLTDSTLQTGLVTTFSTLPVLLFTLYGGVVADRVNRRRWLIWLQGLFLVEAAVLTGLTAAGRITVPWIYALSLVAGVVTAFEIPIRQSYLMELVGRADLMSAIAMNSTSFNLSRVVGPAAAAAVTAAFGAAAAFGVNAVSFVAVLIALYLINPAEAAGPPRSAHRARFRAGIEHVFGDPLARTLLILATVYTLFAASLVAILPAYAAKDVGAGVGGYGGLMSAFGIGAAFGAITLAAIGGRFARERVALASGIGLGASVLLLGLVHRYPVALVLILVAGLCMALSAIMTNTILQTGAPDHLRGQVVGLYSFVVIGLAPIGSAQAGWVGEQYRPAVAIGLGGAVCLGAALIAAWRLGLFARRGNVPVAGRIAAPETGSAGDAGGGS
jgi:MFS family permease